MLKLTLLTLSTACLPGLAFAETDCGNQPSQTAEIVQTIRTPEQFFASQDPVEAAPAKVDPVVILTAQAEEGVMKKTAVQQAAPISAYANLLKRRMTRDEAGLNLFDYAAADAAGELSAITAYTDHLAAQNPDTMTPADQIAYWANLYNALTLKVVLENYPVASIRKIKSGAFKPGPWDRDAVVVNGETLTLNNIEHDILRKRYPDPAFVHYMVNCASIGCPNLSDRLWTGATLESDRIQAAKDFINSPRGARIDGTKLELSSIYNWFKEDFGGSKSETLKHLRQFAGPDLAAAIDAGAKIDGYEYDWSLNQ